MQLFTLAATIIQRNILNLEKEIPAITMTALNYLLKKIEIYQSESKMKCFGLQNNHPQHLNPYFLLLHFISQPEAEIKCSSFHQKTHRFKERAVMNYMFVHHMRAGGGYVKNSNHSLMQNKTSDPRSPRRGDLSSLPIEPWRGSSTARTQSIQQPEQITVCFKLLQKSG